MNQTKLMYVTLAAFCLLALFVIQWSEGAKRNRVSYLKQSFAKRDKLPFGAYAFFRLMETAHGEAEINREPLTEASLFEPYPGFDASAGYERVEGFDKTLVFVSEWLSFDRYEAQTLMDAVRSGGCAFLAARYFGALSDSLGVETSSFADTVETLDEFRAYAPMTARFLSPHLEPEREYRLRVSRRRGYFDELDSARTTVLSRDADGRPVFARVDCGEGAFFLHAEPTVFTNYNALAESATGYVETALSFLPEGQALVWDAYYKPFRKKTSRLGYLFGEPALAWAFRLAVFSILLFALFQIKRRQRPIPVVEPPANDTLEFVTTVGQLYYQHGDHDKLARKKILYFFDYLRERYSLHVDARDVRAVERVSAKTAVPKEDVRVLFKLCDTLEGRPKGSVSEAELGMLNARIEDFHKAAA